MYVSTGLVRKSNSELRITINFHWQIILSFLSMLFLPKSISIIPPSQTTTSTINQSSRTSQLFQYYFAEAKLTAMEKQSFALYRSEWLA